MGKSHGIRTTLAGHDSLCAAIFGISRADLETVTALAAAHASGLPGVTVAQITGTIGRTSARGMAWLERNRWIVRVARVARSTASVWAISEHGLRRLELLGWKPKLHTAEEIAELGNVTLGKTFPIEEHEAERAAS